MSTFALAGLLLCGLSLPAFAVPTLVQTKDATGCANPCTTVSATFDSNVTSGNWIIIPLSYCGNDAGCADVALPTVSSVAKSAGTATIGAFNADRCNAATQIRVCSYSASVTGTGSLTITITVSANADYLFGRMTEWSGIHATPFDQSGVAEGTGTDASVSTDMATAEAGELVIGIIGTTGTLVGTPTGYTDVVAASPSVVYAISAGAAVQTIPWMLSPTGVFRDIVATYKAAAAGASSSGRLLLLGVQ